MNRSIATCTIGITSASTVIFQAYEKSFRRLIEPNLEAFTFADSSTGGAPLGCGSVVRVADADDRSFTYFFNVCKNNAENP
jgi:hypothetical protein